MPGGKGFTIIKYPQLLDLPVFDITGRKYKAVGDNATDNYARIQAAFDDASIAGNVTVGGIVVVPPGRFITSAPLKFPKSGLTVRNLVWLYGTGTDNTSLIRGSNQLFPAGRAVIEWKPDPAWDGTHNVTSNRIQDICIQPPAVDKVAAIRHEPWHSGVSAGASNNTITLSAAASPTNSNYVGKRIEIYSGKGAGQTATVTAYNGSTKVATVTPNWSTLPDDTNATTGSKYAVQFNLQDPALLYADMSNQWMNDFNLENVLIVGAANQYQDVLIDLGIGNRGGTFRNVKADPSRLTVNYITTLIKTPHQWKGADAPVGEDSVGFGFGRIENCSPMRIAGGWVRTFEGRFYGGGVDTVFDNGARSGFGGHAWWLKNSFAATFHNLQCEGNGGGALRLTNCQQLKFTRLTAPPSDPTEAAWLPNHVYATNDLVVQTGLVNASGATSKKLWKCTTPGTSGGSEPSWASSPQSDGTAVWTAESIDAVTDSIVIENSRRITIEGRANYNGNPACSQRLTKLLTVDATSQDIDCTEFDICGLTPTSEITITAGASRVTVSGIAWQYSGDIRQAYQLGSYDRLHLTKLRNEQPTGDVTLDVDAMPGNGTGTGYVQVNRNANTSGLNGLIVYKGNNTPTTNHHLLGNSNSILCGDNGNLAIFGGGSFGSGSKVVFIGNRSVAPTAGPSGGFILYGENSEPWVYGANGPYAVRAMFEVGAYRAGEWTVPGVGMGTFTGASVQNLLTYMPVHFSKAGTITDLAIEVTSGVGSTTVRVGVYADDGNGRPGTLLLEAGTIDSSTTGVKTLTLGSPLNVPAGTVHLAAVAQGGTPSLRFIQGKTNRMTASSATLALQTNHTGWSQSGISGTLPASATVVAQTNAIQMTAKMG